MLCHPDRLRGPLGSVLKFLLLASVAPPLAAQSLRVLSAGAFKPVVLEMSSAYAAAHAAGLQVDNDTAGAILRRIRAGESWDLVIAPPAALKALAGEGRIDAGTIRPLARVAIGVAVRRGSPKPAIDTEEQFREALLRARNPAFIDPKAGGSSGIYLDGLFQRMGIAESIRANAVLVPGGLVAERLVSGEADLAIHQISEILPVAGAELVGPLPESIQNYTVYAAALVKGSSMGDAGRALIELLRSSSAARVIRTKGMDQVD